MTVQAQASTIVIPAALTLGKGETYTLKPKMHNGSSATFTYTSSAAKTVKVSKKGNSRR